MTKIPPNPFDAFPIDGTGADFWYCALSAMNWLEPYLNDNDGQHRMFVTLCIAYCKMIFGDPDHPDQKEDWELLIHRQRMLVTVFKKVRDQLVATDAITKVEKQSNAQRERASQQVKISEVAQKRIVKNYLEKQAAGSVYGVVKDAAYEYSVTRTAIHAILRKHGVETSTMRHKNSIDK